MAFFLKSVARFSHPHYVINLLLSVLFFAVKTISPICDHLFEDCQLELVRHIAVCIKYLQTLYGRSNTAESPHTPATLTQNIS